MTSFSRVLLGALAVVGLAAAAVSAAVHYRLLSEPGYTSFCDINSTWNCTQVYASRFGSVWGVPVAVLGALWFVLAVLLVAAAWGGPKTFRENVPAYLFALSTLALAAVLYLGYASFFVLKTLCILCLVVYAAVIGIFIVSGAATPFPMTTLPRRAVRDLRTLAATPTALLVAMLFLAGAAWAVAFFPREGASAMAATPESAAPASGGGQAETEFDRWWQAQPRVQVPVPDEGAKVLIVKFNDYQCPPCRQTHMTYQSILAKYEASQPGAVKLVTRDYPLDPECNVNTPNGTHLAACEAAVAVRLARRQKLAERMEQWLFTNQESLTPARVRSAAREIGGVEDFDAEYARTLEAVKADIALGRLLQVQATPTFFVNGVSVRGGLPPQYFDAAIALELKRVAQ